MKIVIVGNSDFAMLLYDYLKDSRDMEVLAFSVEDKYINEKQICGIPVISYEEIQNKYSNQEVKLILGVGYSKMHDIKSQLYKLYSDKGYKFTNYIHSSAIVAPDVEIGDGNVILEGVIIERQSHIGNGNLFFGGSVVGHNNVLGNFNTLSIRAATAGFVTIADKCFLGINAVVRDKIKIESHSLIGAGAYVDCNLKEYEVIVPAKSVVLEDKKSIDFM